MLRDTGLPRLNIHSRKIKLMGFPIAEVIGAAGTIGAGALNMQSASKTNLRTRQHNEHMFNKQADLARANWDLQNEYNSPKATKQRLKDAGLNPALVYGQGSTGSNASEVNMPNIGSYNPDTPRLDSGEIGSSLGNVASGMVTLQKSILQQNLMNAKAQEELTRANTNKVNAEARHIDQDYDDGLTVDDTGRPLHLRSKLASYSQLASDARLKAGEQANQPTKIEQENALRKMQTAEGQQRINKLVEEISAIQKLTPEQVARLKQEVNNLIISGKILNLDYEFQKRNYIKPGNGGVIGQIHSLTDWLINVR